MDFLSMFQLLWWKKMQYLCKLSALLCLYDYKMYLCKTKTAFRAFFAYAF